MSQKYYAKKPLQDLFILFDDFQIGVDILAIVVLTR